MNIVESLKGNNMVKGIASSWQGRSVALNDSGKCVGSCLRDDCMNDAAEPCQPLCSSDDAKIVGDTREVALKFSPAPPPFESDKRSIASSLAVKRQFHLTWLRLRSSQLPLLRLWLVAQLLTSMSGPIPSTTLLPVVQGGWIDPDTPEDARTTTRRNVKPAPVPKPSPTKKKLSKHATPAPTSSTDAPTSRPSTEPSSYPTYNDNEHNTFELVFSDEFNTADRSLADGADPRWTALDKNDYTNDALHYYTPEHVTTRDGHLVLTSSAADTDIVGFDDVNRTRTHIRKHFRSGMIQTWNKFCMTGGILEAKVTLPGKSKVGGLWPAFWLLGNLARHTYVGSSQHIWPWASSQCHGDPTENSNARHDRSGKSKSNSATTNNNERSQLISGCDTVSHFGMKSKFGRGAPEIDIFEVQPGNIKAGIGPFFKSPVGQPFMSASYQVAPGRSAMRPGPGEWPGPGQWYDGLMGGVNSSLNILFYGTYNHFLDDVDPAKQDYWSDAISYNRQLTESHFNSSHVYRVEWDVPSNESDGYLHWFVDDVMVSSIDGAGLKAAQNGAEISSEPSYIIVNTAISKQWGFPQECPGNCPCRRYDCRSSHWQDFCGFSEGFCPMMLDEKNPPEYKIDWIRAYQDPNNPQQKVGCSTPERPTRKFIVAHEPQYKRPQDEHPLKGVPTGQGTCDPSHSAAATIAEAEDDGSFIDLDQSANDSVNSASSKSSSDSMASASNCGGLERGRCTQGRVCECAPGWTGPHCLANVAYNDIMYDTPDTILDVGFVPPRVAPVMLWGGLVTLALLLFTGISRRRQLAGWEPIPDAGHVYLAATRKMQQYHRRGQSV